MAPSVSTKPLSSGVPESLVGKLSGHTIAVAGKFSDVTHGDLKRLITALGGKFEADSIIQCTHVIRASDNIETLKVSSARTKKDCELVSYEWLREAISTDNVKELVNQIAGLQISEKPAGKKRKQGEDLDIDGEGSERKAAKHEEVVGPVEVHEDGTVTPITPSKLSEPVEGLLRFLCDQAHVNVFQTYIGSLSALPGLLDDQSRQFLDSLKFFNTLMTETPTPERLYEGLLKLQLKELTALNKGSQEFKDLEEYFTKTQYPGVVPSNIFRIERTGERERFLKWSKAKISTIGNRRLLWHGSHAVNFIGILSHGLCDNTPIVGGRCKGVYFAESSATSLGYCRAASSNFLMLLCEVECGIGMRHLSWAINSAHAKWRDADYVHTGLAGAKPPDIRSEEAPKYSANEHVVPNKDQIRLRYIFQVKE